MIVTKDIDFGKPLTQEQIAMLKKLEESPAVPDEDCPELTPEQTAKFIEAARKRNKRLKTKPPATDFQKENL
ncbi:MAG: hypothetical protein NC078_09560 [Ruminococcus sp.]|nr:hypothetical protein [Ruminococcus sp.]